MDHDRPMPLAVLRHVLHIEVTNQLDRGALPLPADRALLDLDVDLGA